MRKAVRIISFAFAFLFLVTLPFEVFSQGPEHNKGKKKAWPDSLTTVTLQGTVMIDTAHRNIYLLDVDGDSIVDYNLAFGPEWYTPASGAVRPKAGEYVAIVGAINPRPPVPVAIVFELNGFLWREAIENWWKHQKWCDSLEVITVTGKVMVDTTYFYAHYYMDTDDNGEPDYFLSFGPPWYDPESGATRPADGETVTIEGVIEHRSDLLRLKVLKINDVLWREQRGPAPWSGGWIGKNRQSARRIHCPLDSSSWLEIPPGAMKGVGKYGQQFPDSIFCEFMNVWCDSLPGRPDSVLAGWHFHFTNPAGNIVNGKGKAVHFIKRLRLHLSCCEQNSSGYFLSKYNLNRFQVKYWDENENKWIAMEDVIYDGLNQVFYLESESIESYYAIFKSAESKTNILNTETSLPVTFGLEQNYPNPFNPSTTIGFQVNAESVVNLAMFNMLGQQVRSLVSELKPIGHYQVVWDGRDNSGNALPSGLYIYKLQVGNQSQVKRLLLMK